MLISHSTIAQDAGNAKSSGILDGAKSDMTLILALGAGGAILGLSTLSFVETPKDHLKNILVGGAIGIIIGVGVVAWRQATASKEYMGANMLEENSKLFSSVERQNWHYENHQQNNVSMPIDTFKLEKVFTF